jgi:hypothetical protein
MIFGDFDDNGANAQSEIGGRGALGGIGQMARGFRRITGIRHGFATGQQQAAAGGDFGNEISTRGISTRGMDQSCRDL